MCHTASLNRKKEEKNKDPRMLSFSRIFLSLHGAEAMAEEIDLVPASQSIKVGRISEMLSKLGHGEVKQNTSEGKGNMHLCPHTKIT